MVDEPLEQEPEQPKRAAVLTGGPADGPQAAGADWLATFAEAEGFDARVTEDVELAMRSLHQCQLLIVNALRGSGEQGDDFQLSPEGRAYLVTFLEQGGASLASHAAVKCFQDWPVWGSMLGARWVPGLSIHPPLGFQSVFVVDQEHPVTAGLPDRIEVIDELYRDLDLRGDVVGLVTAPLFGRDQPMVWARNVRRGRVVTDILGHDQRSLTAEDHIALLRQAIRWLTDGSGQPYFLRRS